jgi:hypothetical protein
VHIFDMFMVLQEMEAMGFFPKKKDYKDKIDDWRKMFESEMSAATKYKLIPISLNTYDDVKISNLVVNYCKSLILDSNIQKNGKFFTSIKIFEYPNRIISIRIVLASFYKSKVISSNRKIAADDKNIYQLSVPDANATD